MKVRSPKRVRAWRSSATASTQQQQARDRIVASGKSHDWTVFRQLETVPVRVGLESKAGVLDGFTFQIHMEP
jgi:hypothetical protein